MKPEHVDMVAPDDEAALKWAKEDYTHEQVRHQRRAWKDLRVHPRAEEGGLIVIDSDDEGEVGPSSAPPRVGDPGQGCSRGVAGEEYVANRASDKISQLTDNVYVCRYGSAADTQVISDYVRYFLHQHTIQLGQPATVKVASNLVRLLAYQNKSMLQAGMIVGGWDKYEGGQIYSVPLGGTILRQPFAIGGSGSSYLYGLMDHEWKEGMTQEEAEKFVVKVVSLAIARDGASGGVVRTVTINEEGVKRSFHPGDKLPLWHEEMEPQNSLLDILAAGSSDAMVQ
ncbi:proteasome subunit beta type-6-like [Triticum aestivum]|uniref:proteasome subunit beta type-6-like n=1 Tax=Triticum aestivum TaxID=4565 RepID=UPI001D00E10C|nr:proteasome subunit beta type-6-like [Triticum aestivum]